MRLHLGIASLVALVTLGAQLSTTPSTSATPPEDLQAIAAKVHELENTPLTAQAKRQRTDLFAWFAQAPEVTVKWCAGILLDAPRKDKDMAGGLLVQAMLSAGAFVIEHPESSGEGLMVARAGLRGALQAYRATVVAEPKRASRYFDDLIALDAQGKLDEYLLPKMADCK